MQTTNPQTSQETATSQSYYLGQDDGENYQRPDIAKLNGYYLDGESCDQDVFAEMRSNVLLVAGDHYNRRNSRFYKRIRDSKELSQEQKLRLTKNHTRKICQLYSNNIMSMNPSVGFTPKDENSNHDQKVSELHHAVWQDGFRKYNVSDKMDDWCDSFVQLGEVHVKLFYDPHIGQLKGYEPLCDPDGDYLVDEVGAMQPDTKKPMFDGEFVFEEIYGFNLLRPPECKDLRKAEWLGIRKMASKSELMRQFKGQEDKQKFLVTAQDDTYVVFDGIRGGYKKTTNQVMIREYYFRPSTLFPEGYFYITTKEGILAEGELPGGLFPIITGIFDKIQTHPRGRSPVKTMRPFQAEINRASSKIAEHQITLGDDKLLIQNGMKVSAGASLPGVRTVSYTGSAPTVLQGRSGEQYFSYLQNTISEMYQVMMVQEDSEMKDSQVDPYSLLFKAAREKKKFQRYIKRFEKFYIEIVSLYLKLAKLHLPDDAVIFAVGKNEQVNIPEFRQYPDIVYEINIEAQADDIETKMGKQMVLNHALQYVGSKLDTDAIGQIMRQMPYANFDKSFEDMTMNYDMATNKILALDRGEQPKISQNENHQYLLKKLTGRANKADFQFLPPQVQNNYEMAINIHSQMEAANQMSIQRAAQGFIPTGGGLIPCDFYVEDPTDPTGLKTRRARVPYQAMEWLIKQLQSQGQDQQSLQKMDQAALGLVSNKMNQAQSGMGPGGPGGLNPLPQHGGLQMVPHGT